MTSTQKHIVEVFVQTEKDFPDASTEFILQATADRWNRTFRQIDCSDVAAALSADQKETEK